MALAPAGFKTPLLLLLILFSVTCSYGDQKQQSINSCGDNLDISFPFQGDPSNNTCNDYFYTLSCDENNRTVLPLVSGKYYVQSIDYTDHSIRLVDVGIQTNNICSSFPLSSFDVNDFRFFGSDMLSRISVLFFLSCENPVQSPIYINRTRYCNTRDDSGNGYYSYVVAAKDVRLRDIADSCLVEGFYLSSSPLVRKRGSNLSWLDLNKELGYGFDILWGYSFCVDLPVCSKRASCCFGDSVNVTAVCSRHEYCQNGISWREVIVYAGSYVVYYIVPPIGYFTLYGESVPSLVLHLITRNLKLNTDGCWYESNGLGGFGGLFRNHSGDWIMGYYGRRSFNSSLEAELWSIHKGLEVILERKLENVKIESDSLVAMNLVMEGNPGNHPHSVLINEAHFLLAQTNTTIGHIPRTANQCADHLARMGVEHTEDFAFVLDMPTEMREFVIRDSLIIRQVLD